MSFHLRSFDNPVPGGYQFTEGGSKPRKFRQQPVPEPLAREVAAYRAANGLPRATYPESLQDVSSFQCERLGNNPAYCVSSDIVGNIIPLAADAPGLAPCKSCGAVVE